MAKPVAVAGGTIVVTKCLTEASLLGPLSLPTVALHSLPHFEADNAPVVIDAIDVKGALHKLRVSIRGSGKFKKPNILKSCWVPYARAKRLLPKDKLTRSRISGARADAGVGMEVPSYVIRAQRNMFKLFCSPLRSSTFSSRFSSSFASQKSRFNTASPPNLSGLQAMYSHKFADRCATAITRLLFNTISSSSSFDSSSLIQSISPMMDLI